VWCKRTRTQSDLIYATDPVPLAQWSDESHSRGDAAGVWCKHTRTQSAVIQATTQSLSHDGAVVMQAHTTYTERARGGKGSKRRASKRLIDCGGQPSDTSRGRPRAPPKMVSARAHEHIPPFPRYIYIYIYIYMYIYIYIYIY